MLQTDAFAAYVFFMLSAGLGPKRSSHGRTMETMTERKPFDIETRWPDVFAPLSAEQRTIVVQTLANQWLEGWEPNRGDVADLADLVRGALTEAEYDARARARAKQQAAARG
ncbi:hypothetical protein [Agromyces neolithicus]|uniref:Antitoxin VbhA domain-containing protein n=1 Tax=Agromyces neolithicus TaxID=269420 RepID=A0ABN2MD81_9MICO